MKFETMWIHFLSNVFRLLSSRTFATMATRHNSFSSQKLKIFMKWSIPMYVHVIFKGPKNHYSTRNLQQSFSIYI